MWAVRSAARNNQKPMNTVIRVLAAWSVFFGTCQQGPTQNQKPPNITPKVVLIPGARDPSQGETETPLATYTPAEKYDPRRDPAADLAGARAEALRTHRNVILEVGNEECVPCHAMDEFFRGSPDLEVLLEQNYVLVKVNVSEASENRNFILRFPRIASYPHLFFLDSDGKLIYSQSTKSLKNGKSYNLKRFEDALKRFAPKVQSATRQYLTLPYNAHKIGKLNYAGVAHW